MAFPRRVAAYYLLFCMVAVTWLAVGVLLTAHTILAARTNGSCLSTLGKTAAALEIDFLRHGSRQLQHAVERTRTEKGLLACAIIAPDNTFLAHSDPSWVGKPIADPEGVPLRWGDVSEVAYVDERGDRISEFRVPLVADGDHFGTLSVTVQQLSLWNTLAVVARVAPLHILVPLSFVAAGAYFLARLTSPVGEVDRQLRAVAAAPVGADLSLMPLRPNHAVALGWNRIVDMLASRTTRSEGGRLIDSLASALATRKHDELVDVLQNLCEGVAVTDVEGRITFANRAIAALIAHDTPDAELAGLELVGNLLADSPQAHKCPLLDAESLSRPVVSEVTRGSDVRGRVLRVARLPLTGENARGHVWSVRDITQQKLAEKMRDQFIDAATHELRTPLSNIKAYSETLATCETIDVDQQREFCEIINSEVTRLARFVDDLLSISSMESGSLSIDRQVTDAARMFAEAISKVEPLMKQKQIEFEVHLPEKMRELHLDKDKIIAVLVNLLGNAAKYTPVGGRVSLRVKLDGTHLQIAVEDTGIGIAADELPKVFEKFFRSADARVQAETGTGLGLALAREVVRMHGGEIVAESQVNQGTTFTATIPVN
jgi:signal transduction histidine kinase